METIKFNGFFSDGIKRVELSDNHYGGGGYQVYIDGFYHGSLYRNGTAWMGHLNDRSTLGTDEVQILGMIIDEEAGQSPFTRP